MVLLWVKIGFPYHRQFGVQGEWEIFKTPDEYLKYICNNEKAELLWTDNEEIHAMANLYQINIKVIRTKGVDDPNPTINIVGPKPILNEFSILPAGIVPDMTLLYSHDSHYDLIVSRSSRLAQSVLQENKSLEPKEQLHTLKEEH